MPSKKKNNTPWAFYDVDEAGKVTLFNVDNCEKCGVEVEAPNSVGSKDSIAKLNSLGIIRKELPSSDLGHNEELGMAVCSTCETNARDVALENKIPATAAPVVAKEITAMPVIPLVSRIPATLVGAVLPKNLSMAEAAELANKAGKEAQAAFRPQTSTAAAAKPAAVKPAPKAPVTPVAAPVKPAPSKALQVKPEQAELTQAVIAAITARPGITRAQLIQECQQPEGATRAAVRALMDSGFVVRTGVAEAASYRLASDAPPDLASRVTVKERTAAAAPARAPQPRNMHTPQLERWFTIKGKEIHLTLELAWVGRDPASPNANVCSLDKNEIVATFQLRPQDAPSAPPVAPPAIAPVVVPAAQPAPAQTAHAAVAPPPVWRESDVVRLVCAALSTEEAAKGIALKVDEKMPNDTFGLDMTIGCIHVGRTAPKEIIARAVAAFLFRRSFPKTAMTTKDGKSVPALAKMQERAVNALS